jgi:hypothetical protein
MIERMNLFISIAVFQFSCFISELQQKEPKPRCATSSPFHDSDVISAAHLCNPTCLTDIPIRKIILVSLRRGIIDGIHVGNPQQVTTGHVSTAI